MAKRKKPTPKKRGFDNRPLAGLARLKKAARTRQPETPASEMDGTGPASGDEPAEEVLFSDAMAGVAPIRARGRRRALRTDPPPVTPGEAEEAEEVMQALRDLVEGDAPLSIHETDEAIEGAVDGLDPRILKKLRKGEFSLQDHLDLHGCNREEARAKVKAFLLQAIAHGKRCVLVIHGRGLGSKDRIPVLKNALASWFTRRALRKHVLAFTTARAVDGGAGAVYVLLRKHRGKT